VVQHDDGRLLKLLGRFFMIIPVLAIGRGSLAKKKIVPESAGTFPVNRRAYSPAWLVSTISDRRRFSPFFFFPALSLGADSRTPADERRKGSF